MGRSEVPVSPVLGILSVTKVVRSLLTQAAINELDYSFANVTAELDRLQPFAHIQEAKEGPLNPEMCSCCGEYSSQLRCDGCDKGWHSICLNPPTLKRFETNEADRWTCPFCRCLNKVNTSLFIAGIDGV